MEIFTIVIISLTLLILGILIALIKILTGKETNRHSKEQIRITKKLIIINFAILLFLLVLSYIVTTFIS